MKRRSRACFRHSKKPVRNNGQKLAVQEKEAGLNVQIWKNYTDEMSITLVNPSGVQIGPLQEVLGPQRFRVGQTELFLYYGMPAPYSTRQEIFIDFLAVNDYIASGCGRSF